MTTLETASDTIGLASQLNRVVYDSETLSEYLEKKLIAFLHEGHYLYSADWMSGYSAIIEFDTAKKLFQYTMVDTVRQTVLMSITSTTLADLIVICNLNLSFFSMVSRQSVETVRI